MVRKTVHVPICEHIVPKSFGREHSKLSRRKEQRGSSHSSSEISTIRLAASLTRPQVYNRTDRRFRVLERKDRSGREQP